MESSKKVNGPIERTTINMNEGFDVRYWSNELGVSAVQLKEITTKVGTNVEDVRKEIVTRGHHSWRS
jgi:hypothetical protein